MTTKSNGTGLGLAIVKRIAEAHGGELTIESTAIAGTTIALQLPSMTAKAQSENASKNSLS